MTQNYPVRTSYAEMVGAIGDILAGSYSIVHHITQCTLQLPEVHIFIGTAWFVQ